MFKQKHLFPLFFVLILFSINIFSILTVYCSDLYEYHSTSLVNTSNIKGAVWICQTFTVVGNPHSVTSVKFKLFRSGLPDTLTVAIRNTGGENKPTGSNLAYGSLNASSFTTDTNGIWYEFDMNIEYDLSSDTLYAIVLYAPAGNDTNYVGIKEGVGGANVYLYGSGLYSVNSGASWSFTSPATDFGFEVWGNPVTPAEDYYDPQAVMITNFFVMFLLVFVPPLFLAIEFGSHNLSPAVGFLGGLILTTGIGFMSGIVPLWFLFCIILAMIVIILILVHAERFF